MHKEDFPNNIRTHRIRRPTPNTHEDTRSHQAIKLGREPRPHARQDQNQQAKQDDWPPPKRIRQRNPPQVRRAQHEHVDGDEVRQRGEGFGRQPKDGRRRVDGQGTGNRGTGEVDDKRVYRHDCQRCYFAPHGQVEGVGWVRRRLGYKANLIVVGLRCCVFEMFCLKGGETKTSATRKTLQLPWGRAPYRQALQYPGASRS